MNKIYSLKFRFLESKLLVNLVFVLEVSGLLDSACVLIIVEVLPGVIVVVCVIVLVVIFEEEVDVTAFVVAKTVDVGLFVVACEVSVMFVTPLKKN